MISSVLSSFSDFARWTYLPDLLGWIALFVSAIYIRHFFRYLTNPKSVRDSRYQLPTYRRPPPLGAIQEPDSQMEEEPPEVTARVVRVLSGDTFAVATEGVDHEIPIRLALIDAPAPATDAGVHAKYTLMDLIGEQDVLTTMRAADAENRCVCDVTVSGLWVNREMVRLGLAQPNKDGKRNIHILKALAEAKAQGNGIWGTANNADHSA